MSVADVLRVQELSLVGHDLGGLLAVEYGEVGGHVDEDAGVRRKAARGLSSHEGGRGGAGRGRRRGGAGGGGGAGLAGRGASGSAGHHWDGFEETSAAGPTSCRPSR